MNLKTVPDDLATAEVGIRDNMAPSAGWLLAVAAQHQWPF